MGTGAGFPVSSDPTHTDGPYLCTLSGSPPCNLPSDTTTSFPTVFRVYLPMSCVHRDMVPPKGRQCHLETGASELHLPAMMLKPTPLKPPLGRGRLAEILLVFPGTADFGHTLLEARAERQRRGGHNSPSHLLTWWAQGKVAMPHSCC